ncbi:MAG: helix-turn-helix transcriptional regulator [Bacteroidales bacterium]|nr:helix-turn-helix transcriptional regulator [Bacteroidales bacterium]
MIERIKQLMDIKDLSLSQFADMIQIQRSSLSHVMNGRNKPSLDFILKVLSCYPEINTDWLLFGKGVMDNSPNLFSDTDLEHTSDSINALESKIEVLNLEHEGLLELNREKELELEAVLQNSEQLKNEIIVLKDKCEALAHDLLEKEKIIERENQIDDSRQVHVTQKQIKQILLVFDDGNLEAYDQKNKF